MPIKRDTYNDVTPYSQPILDKSCIIYEKLDTNPPVDRKAGIVTVNTDVRFGTQSLFLDTGSLRLGSTTPLFLGLHWELGLWIKLTSTQTTQLCLIEGNYSFGFSYDTVTKDIILQYQPSPGSTVQRKLPLNITTGWHYLTLTRNNDKITVEIDFTQSVEFNDVYFPPFTGLVYLGKPFPGTTNTGQFKAQSASVRNSDKPIILLERSLTLHENYYKPYEAISNVQQSTLLALPVENDAAIAIYPSNSLFSLYSHESNSYEIAPSPVDIDSLDNLQGLRAVREDRFNTFNGEYAVDCIFKLASIGHDVTIYTNYINELKSGETLTFEAATRRLVLRYYSNTLQLAVIPFNLEADTPYRVVVVRRIGTLTVYINGSQVYNQPANPSSTISLDYRFNYNSPAVQNSSTVLELLKFSVKAISDDFLPFFEPLQYESVIPVSNGGEPFKYHQIYDRLTVPPFQILFSTPDSVNITPGQVLVNLPVTQQYFGQDVRYTVRAVMPENSTLSASDITLPAQFTVPAGTLTYNLPLGLSIFDKFKRGTYYYLYLSNGPTSRKVRVNIANIPAADLNLLKGNGHVNSFLALNNWIGFNSGTATGSGQYLAYTLYGPAYKIDTAAQGLTLPAMYDNVRTIFLVYHETQYSQSRLYVGGPSYTFNGGLSGELTGDLLTDADEWLIARRDTARYKNVALSANGEKLVRANETAQQIEVLSKNQTWNVPVVNLSLNLQAPSTVDSASIAINPTGTYACLGFPNANNAEGVVQLWNLATMTKELHLGSPVPTISTGGFGMHVELSSSGNTLYCSETGTNKLYVYRKTTAWSATPLHTFTYATAVIQVSTFANYLLVTTSDRAIYLYSESTPGVWTVLNTWTGAMAEVDKLSSLFYIYNDLANTVKIYSVINLTTPVRTITTTGYVKVSLVDGSLLIANVDSGDLSYYSSYTAISPVVISNTLDDYGIFTAMSADSLVVSDYGTVCDIYTSDSTAYGERLLKVHVDGELVNPNTTILTTDNVHVLCFTTAIPMSINQIGTGNSIAYGASSLKGLLLGAFMYTQVFSEEDIIAYTDRIKTLLTIQEAALSE